jgi:hypothetical protein
VQVPDSEGPANHTGPESCAGIGNGVGEALTGEHAGRVWSPAIGLVLGADALRTRGRQPCRRRSGKAETDPAGSETSGMRSNTVCGPREALPLACRVIGRSARCTHGARPWCTGAGSRTAAEYRGSLRTKVAPGDRRSRGREGRGPRGTWRSQPGAGHSAGVSCPRRSAAYGRPLRMPACRPEAGARCGSAARRDLCGGCRVTGIPTATVEAVEADQVCALGRSAA